jgi:hypothetical protein
MKKRTRILFELSPALRARLNDVAGRLEKIYPYQPTNQSALLRQFVEDGLDKIEKTILVGK